MNKDNTVYILFGQKDFNIDSVVNFKEHFLALASISNDGLTKFSRKLHLPLYSEFYHNRCFIDKCENVPHYLLKQRERFFCKSHLFEWAEAVGPTIDSSTILCQHLHLWTSDDDIPYIHKQIPCLLFCFKQKDSNLLKEIRLKISYFCAIEIIRECILKREVKEKEIDSKEAEEWIVKQISSGKDREQIKKSICNKFKPKSNSNNLHLKWY